MQSQGGSPAHIGMGYGSSSWGRVMQSNAEVYFQGRQN